ncbi:MAG: helix-turn-helix transcriptional regulator [Desulfotomaculaceae bacterium]|nr:helix-turn-helix transcriptional regulator [Desulfotomaculaceae bacterium]
MDIGNRIAFLRDQARLTGSALAAKVGLDQSQICKIEKGVCNPSINTLRKICAALDISLAQFFSEEYFEEKPEHLQRLLNQAKKLSPEEVLQLCNLLEIMITKKEK